MECYITHMILQIPLPSRGQFTIRYLLESYGFSIFLPPCNKLPLLDLNLAVLFNSLDLDNLLVLFRNILLEKSIVFVSAEVQKLAYCTYALITLIFPFHWNMVYVPILPINLLDYLYSPVTFIFGVLSSQIEEIFSRITDQVCVIDLDNNKFLLSETPTYHRKNSNNQALPKLPDHYGKKLRKQLQTVLGKAGLEKTKAPKLLKPELDANSVQTIRNYFFRFFVSVLKDYKKFVNFEKKEASASSFNSIGFLHQSSDKEFMSQFIETQMFSNFCESRIRPKNVEEHCEGLFFDEEILAKEKRSSRSVSKPINFINDSSQDHHSTYTVTAIDTIFKTSKRYLYSTFPDFDMKVLEDFPLPNTKPPKYAENIEKLPKIAPNWRTDMECLLTSCMDLWGLFITCQDKSEHSLRLQELISIAGLLEHSTFLPTISIYKYLLERCFIVQPSLALPIFLFMNSAKIPIDAETLHLLQRIVSKLHETDHNIVIQNTGTELLITQSSKLATQEAKLQRVFTKPDDTNVFAKQEVSFLVKEVCKKCGKILKADDLAQGWTRVAYVYETACPGCAEKILPKLLIRLGLEIGYSKDKPTSMHEETLLISPQAFRQLVTDLIVSQKHLDLYQFRTGYPMIFWNAIWYFYQKNLPFDFLLLYDKEEIRSDLFLTTENLQTGWSFDVADKSIQTDLTVQDITNAEERYKKFLSFLNENINI